MTRRHSWSLRTPVAVAAAAALALVSACSGDTDPATSADSGTDETVAECQAATPSGSFEWTDARGNVISLDEVPSTVVAQTSVAAALWDAGYDVDGVFGETDTSAPGTAAQLGNVDLDQVEVIGSTYGEFDVDAYAKLQPQLLLDYVFDGSLWYVPSKQAKQIEKLAPIGGVEGQPADIDTAIAQFVDLAGKLGTDTTCNEELNDSKAAYTDALAKVGESGKGLKVLLASASSDLFYVVNPTKLPETQTMTEAGIDVIGPKKDNGQVFEDYSWEELGQFADADVILLDGRNSKDVTKEMEGIDTWTSLPAVEAGQVYTWHAGAPYSYQSYADVFGELANDLSQSKPVDAS